MTGFRSPEGVNLEFTYDAKGNLFTDTLKAAGNDETAVFTYNAKGKVTSVRDAKQTGAVTTLTYAANGVDLIRLEDGLGAITASYNGTHDITSLTDRLGSTKSFDYNDYGQLVRTVQTVGSRNIQTDYAYNESHHLIRIERAGAVVARYGYDDIGRINSHTDANGYTLRYDYNNLDELLTITYPDGRTTEYVLTPGVPHQVKRVTDRAGRTVEYAHNAHKRVTEVLPLLPGAVRTRFFYYPAGQIREILDPNGNSTQFDYDRDGRLTRKRFADNSSVRIAYSNGRPNRFTSGRGITTDYTYDKNGNVLTIVYSNGTPGVTTIYDDYNRPVEIRDGLGAHRIAYDAASRPVAIDGPWEDDTLTFGYDALGRKTSVTLGIGSTVTYGYDDLDRLTSAAGHGLTYTYVYPSGSSLLERLERSDNSRTEYVYDPVMKRLEKFTNRSRTGAVLDEYAFEFDLLGQPVKETVTGGPAVQFADAGADFYAYNNLNQETSHNGSEGVFAYDADGNMIRGLTGAGRPFEAAWCSSARRRRPFRVTAPSSPTSTTA